MLRSLSLPKKRSRHDQAHLPAQQSQARPYPRFSRPDEDRRWSQDHQCASCQGPSASDPVSAGPRRRQRVARQAGGTCGQRTRRPLPAQPAAASSRPVPALLRARCPRERALFPSAFPAGGCQSPRSGGLAQGRYLGRGAQPHQARRARLLPPSSARTGRRLRPGGAASGRRRERERIARRPAAPVATLARVEAAAPRGHNARRSRAARCAARRLTHSFSPRVTTCTRRCPPPP